MKLTEKQKEITRIERTIALDLRRIEQMERTIASIREGIEGLRSRLLRLKNDPRN